MQQPPYGGPPHGGQQPYGQQQQQWPQQQQQQWPQPQPGYPGQGQWPGQQPPPPKKKSHVLLIVCIIGAVLLGSCGLLVALSSGGPTKPGTVKVEGSIPSAKKEYEGSWIGPGVALHIAHDGTVFYKRKTGKKSSSIDGLKIDRFEKDDFVVSVIFTDTTFVVSEPPTAPAEKDGKWTMTVDGIELVRFAGPGEPKVDHGVRVSCKPTEKGADCTAIHSGGVDDIKACYDIELSCKNGKSPKQNRCEEVEVGGKKEHSFVFADIDSGKECDKMTDYSVKNIDLDTK